MYQGSQLPHQACRPRICNGHTSWKGRLQVSLELVYHAEEVVVNLMAQVTYLPTYWLCCMVKLDLYNGPSRISCFHGMLLMRKSYPRTVLR